MRTKTIDLYRHFSRPAPENGAGRLSAWITSTPSCISPGRTRPAVLIIPGGGYSYVSPREAEPVALRFAAMGYVPFVLEYSCAPHIFPTALREAAMAMAYIRENAGETEVNPHMVAAMGFSAGAHLCGCLGTMFDCPELSDLGSGGLFRPDALGLCYPVAVSWGRTHEGSFENISGGDPALRRRLSLDTLVRPDMPPAYLWHTRDDQAVPCRNTLVLAQAMEEAGVELSLHLYRHGAHGLSTADTQVYSAGAVPDISPNIPGWLEEMALFWAECGFKITD